MDHKLAAPTPPLGWNSWDCYGAAVTEDEIRGNAEYMAKHLKAFGWSYITVDIQWYEPYANSSQYRPFVPLVMDGYSRVMPAENRFPSAAGGQGFKPLADYVHSLGLQFGIHIMRGIPRQAVHAATPILGTAATARDIAHTNSICPWNTDMYGVDASKEGAQAYYDSLFELYAEWGVDLVKVDDIAASKLYDTHQPEIALISKAIERCGRPMVLSLSPDPLRWNTRRSSPSMPTCGVSRMTSGTSGRSCWICSTVAGLGRAYRGQVPGRTVTCCHSATSAFARSMEGVQTAGPGSRATSS